MGISVYIYCDNGTESIPIAGQNEINDLWTPVIHEKGLDLIGICVSGGLQVDDEVYLQLMDELSALLHEIESRSVPSDYPLSPSARFRRLLDTLRQHPPSSRSKVYIG